MKCRLVTADSNANATVIANNLNGDYETYVHMYGVCAYVELHI